MIEEKRPNENRIGCDLCKQDKPTEKFVGRVGNVLWFCSGCQKILIEGSNIIRKVRSKD